MSMSWTILVGQRFMKQFGMVPSVVSMNCWSTNPHQVVDFVYVISFGHPSSSFNSEILKIHDKNNSKTVSSVKRIMWFIIWKCHDIETVIVGIVGK